MYGTHYNQTFQGRLAQIPQLERYSSYITIILKASKEKLYDIYTLSKGSRSEVVIYFTTSFLGNALFGSRIYVNIGLYSR
jgi:hypothetical protein